MEIGVADEEPAAWEVEGEEAVAGTHGQPAEAEEAENLIGLDEAAKNDPLKHYVVVQKSDSQVARGSGANRKTGTRSAQGEQQVLAEMRLVVSREICHGHALELREVRRRLSTAEAELQALEGSRDRESQVLVVQSGDLLSMFLPESWCLHRILLWRLLTF